MQFPVSPEVVEALQNLRKRKAVVVEMTDIFMSRLEVKLLEIEVQESDLWDSIIEDHSLDTNTHNWDIQTLEDGSTVVVSSPKGVS